LSLAVDRQSIVKNVLGGYASVARGFLPDSDRCYSSDAFEWEYNTEKARKLLDGAGYHNEEIILDTTDGQFTGDRAVSEAVVAMWRRVGVNAKLQVRESVVLSQMLSAKSFRGWIVYPPADSLFDPEGIWNRLLAPGGQRRFYINAELDRLLLHSAATLDVRTRCGSYGQAFKLMRDQMPVIVVDQPRFLFGVANGLTWRAQANEIIQLTDFATR